MSLVLCLYLGVVLLVWGMQDALIFPGASAYVGAGPERTALAAREGITEAWLDREDGSKLLVWHRRTEGRRAVLYLHGNGALVSHVTPLATYLARLGWDTVAMEFRGYGDTDGRPSEAALAADLRQTIDWLVSTGIARDQIVIHGRSMGGGVAGTVAGEIEVGGWVFESTFDSVRAMASRRFWFLPVRWFLRSPLDSASRVGDIQAPVLQIHSHIDEVVPYDHGRSLAEAMPDHATFVEVEDQSHNILMSLVDPVAHKAYLALLSEVSP